jgi:hypothetical protein
MEVAQSIAGKCILGQRGAGVNRVGAGRRSPGITAAARSKSNPLQRRRFADTTVLQAAAAFEQARPKV